MKSFFLDVSFLSFSLFRYVSVLIFLPLILFVMCLADSNFDVIEFFSDFKAFTKEQFSLVFDINRK